MVKILILLTLGMGTTVRDTSPDTTSIEDDGL